MRYRLEDNGFNTPHLNLKMEQLMLGEFMVLRKPTSDELRLLHFLISKAEDCEVAENWPSTLMVADMNDEGMGSLQLYPEGLVVGSRTMGRRASECQFSDDDGIEVIASLNIDNAGRPYELDIWKTNFERLKRIPVDVADLRDVNY